MPVASSTSGRIAHSRLGERRAVKTSTAVNMAATAAKAQPVSGRATSSARCAKPRAASAAMKPSHAKAMRSAGCVVDRRSQSGAYTPSPVLRQAAAAASTAAARKAAAAPQLLPSRWVSMSRNGASRPAAARSHEPRESCALQPLQRSRLSSSSATAASGGALNHCAGNSAAHTPARPTTAASTTTARSTSGWRRDQPATATSAISSTHVAGSCQRCSVEASKATMRIANTSESAAITATAAAVATLQRRV